MEQELRLKTKDGKIIYGVLRGSLDKPIIVLVHGLASHIGEALHYNAARYFEKYGFSSLRFNLYSWQKDARKMHECTLKTHGADIDAVLEYLEKKKVKQIFIAGHSYGFPSILHTKNRIFRAVVSWDGTILPRNNFIKMKRTTNPKGRIFDEGYLTIMGEDMAVEEGKVDSIVLIKALRKPIKFITVDNKKRGNLVGAKKAYRAAPELKALTIIKGASHNFLEEGKEEELYAETVSWFKKYL